MDNDRFARIVEDQGEQLRTLMSPLVGVLGGGLIAYNAYFNGTEVVVLGYQRPDGAGGTLTRPVAILVDEEVFDRLQVDDEAGRVDGDGRDVPKHVI